jgi:hypothetical protein
MGMLDAFVDGEIDEAARAGMLAHARECESCAGELMRAEALRDALQGADADVVLPLQAQAAWREAVRREGSRRRALWLYKRIGAVAAAFLLMIGVAAGYRVLNRDAETIPVGRTAAQTGAPEATGFVFVASDGGEEISTMLAASTDTVEMNASARIASDDIDAAVEMVQQLTDEFNGYVATSSVNASAAYITAYLPVEETDAFLDSLSFAGAVDGIRMSGEPEGMACVTITIKAK